MPERAASPPNGAHALMITGVKKAAYDEAFATDADAGKTGKSVIQSPSYEAHTIVKNQTHGRHTVTMEVTLQTVKNTRTKRRLPPNEAHTV